MPNGWCPFAVRKDDATTYGYPAGTHGQNRPRIFVDHIMAGWKRTLDDGSWRSSNRVGVHFGIGRDGSISQYASILDAHWGNGVVGAARREDRSGIERYDRSNRHLAAIEREGEWRSGSANWWLRARSGGSLLNQRSISIEHEGFPFDRAGLDATWPETMIGATIRVKRWCLEELKREGLPMTTDDEVLIGHFQIDGVNRKNCPGPKWPRDRILAEVTGLKEEAQDMPKLIRIKGTSGIYQFNGGSLELIPSTNIMRRAGLEGAPVIEVEKTDPILGLPTLFPRGVPPELREV